MGSVLVDGTDCCLCVHCLFPALSQQHLPERQEHHQDTSPVYHHRLRQSPSNPSVRVCRYSFRLKSRFRCETFFTPTRFNLFNTFCQIRSLTTKSNLLFAARSVFFMFYFFFCEHQDYNTLMCLSCCVLN